MAEDPFQEQARAVLEHLGPLAFDRDTERLILLVLETMREQLGADAVYLGEFLDHQEVVHSAVGEPERFGLGSGVRIPQEQSLSARVLAGRVSNAIGDVAADPDLSDLHGSHRIGSFIGAGIWGEDGQILGMICAVNAAARPDLDLADVRSVEVFATLLATRLRGSKERHRSRERLRQRLRAVLADGLDIAFQPIVDIRGGSVVGVEALARFPEGGDRTPQLWFAEAHRLGVGLDLEAAAIRTALAQQWQLPDHVYLSLNVSPALLRSERLPQLLAEVDPRSVVLEMTEHVPIPEYEPLRETLRPFRERGTRLAIDDAGAGFASFRHVLELRPDVIKLDVQLTRGLRQDTPRRALARALSAFALDTEVDIVAEGVEHVAVVDELRRSGICFAQGYLFAPPRPLPLRHLDYPIIIASNIEEGLVPSQG